MRPGRHEQPPRLPQRPLLRGWYRAAGIRRGMRQQPGLQDRLQEVGHSLRWPAAALLAACLVPAPASANGALPATIQVPLPPAAPPTTVVRTNFGLISSTDGGGSWRWTCEHDRGSQGRAYQLAAPPGV